jgi:hypothetical protein
MSESIVNSLTLESLRDHLQQAGYRVETLTDPVANLPYLRSATAGVGFDIRPGNQLPGDDKVFCRCRLRRRPSGCRRTAGRPGQSLERREALRPPPFQSALSGLLSRHLRCQWRHARTLAFPDRSLGSPCAGFVAVSANRLCGSRGAKQQDVSASDRATHRSALGGLELELTIKAKPASMRKDGRA